VELMKDIIRKVGGNTAAGLRAAAVSAAEAIIRAMEGAA